MVETACGPTALITAPDKIGIGRRIAVAVLSIDANGKETLHA